MAPAVHATATATATAAATAAASRSPASSRPPSGLGRGLARILRRSGGGRGDLPGLQHFLGPSLPTTSRLVRDFVVETALGAIADGFEAEAVVIARRDDDGQLAVVSSRIPPSWAEATSLTFELFGMLWYWLDKASYAFDNDRRRRDGEAGPLGTGGRYLWIGAQPLASGHLAAAVVRHSSFSDLEEVTLNRLVRSVAVALGGEAPALPPGAVVDIDSRREPGGRWAVDVGIDLGLGPGGEQRRLTASGASEDLATATAALHLCDPANGAAYKVTFAGHTELDGSRVTIVLVDEGQGSPLLGLAISDPGDLTGTVEAVYSALTTGRPAGRDGAGEPVRTGS